MLLLALVIPPAGGLVMSACGDEESTQPTGPGSGGGTPSSSSTANGGNGGNGNGGNGGGGGAGLGGSVNCEPPTADPIPALKLADVAVGLTAPVLVKAAGSDATRLYVVEQGGLIRLIKNGALVDKPFLDVSALVTAAGEYGLLGLTFHPEYEQNGRFFVRYSSIGGGPLNVGDAVIAEFKRSADPDVADPIQVAQVLTEAQPSGIHNGGSIEFGGDGMLYIALGDGAPDDDDVPPIGNGQNPDTFNAKILRIDVTTLPYTVPPGNLGTAGFRPEIWDYGLRNPWRMSFDGCTGDLYIGDVGQAAWEEIDVEPAGQGHKNYGWRCREGMHDFNLDCGPNADSAVDPTIEYSHNDGNSVTGGYVYRGSAIPGLRGTYFYGDFTVGVVNSFVWQDGAVSQQTTWADLHLGDDSISSFGQDAAGELYVVDYTGGTIYRIDPN